ncbi:hypothetical protein [Clostridium sp. CF012]|uniref:hypothetical protein n=1 Tax=Clostridium sp. CF012 TaxID=2843319 RepID=UPI001C0E6985|nr:hypothetical protein [Clostridium sp. CF012]MBU3145855.1 hypothetical protein [Clostridium sp. CF012]
MQIVKYEIKNNILIVGFKEENFVVYAQIAFFDTKTKQELLQIAYIQCKNSIEYEKTLETHALTIDKEGEEFTPQIPMAVKLNVNFNTLTGQALDQYGEVFSIDIIFTVEDTDKATISDNKVIEAEVFEDTNYFIIAKFNMLEEKQERILHATKIIDENVDDEKIAIAEAIIDLSTRIQILEEVK